ncbi:MAG: histidine kinase [Lewinellaceae bacterium]|nr:histidine kinase [Lewinellaceae bacterium]
MYRKAKYRLFLAFLALPFWLSGQQFNFRNYTVQEGLAQSRVNALLEDSRGYIWMGTEGGGLSCYDGQRFQNFSTRDGLPGNYITALHETSDGQLWIGARNGLCRYDGLAFKPVAAQLDSEIHAIRSTGPDTVWIGASSGLFLYIHDSIPLTRISDSPTYCLFQEGQRLWMGAQSGIEWYENGRLIRPSLPGALAQAQVRSISRDSLGQIWMGTYGRGLYRYDGHFQLVYQNISNFILCLLPASDGRLWAGTLDAGLMNWAPEGLSYEQLTEADGLCSNHILAIAESRWGDFWFGSGGNGVSQYSGQQFVQYTEKDGLPDNYTYALATDTAGHLLLSCGQEGITRYNDTTFQRLPGFGGITSRALITDDSNRVWAGTEGRGLFILGDTAAYSIDKQAGLSGNWVRVLIREPSGTIVAGTADGGISRVQVDSLPDGLRIQTIGKNEGLIDERIFALLRDSLGQLWYGTPSGLGLWAAGRTRFFITQAEGMPRGAIRCLAQDSTGFVWVGTAGGGIARLSYQSDSCRAVPVEGLTSNNIYLLACGPDGQLWAGSQLGLDRLTLDAEGNVKSIRHFGRAEGFAGIETAQNAVLKDRQGNLWFGTVNGLMRYNAQYSFSNAIPPALHFTDIRLFYEPLERTPYASLLGPWHQLKDSLVLPYNQNHLEFEFLGINHPNPEKATYQWRLLGQETEWSPPSRRNNVTYSNLPPGNYTFQVRAFNEDGVPTPTPLEASFTIEPPFWATWWFRMAAIGALALLIALFTGWRIRRIRQQARLDRDRLEMEKHLLELEQKALQLQMNPHFIFNALNSIQSMIVQQDQATARRLLNQFARLMRAILYNSRKERVSLEDELTVLRNYLGLESHIRGGLFDYDIQLSPGLEEDTVLLPPMLLQPFLENAIRHGIAPSGKKGHIKLAFQQKGPILEIIIRDNGIGIEESRRKNKDTSHQSTALQSIRERLEVLSKEHNIRAPLEIREWMMENGEVGGTEVVVRVAFSE